MVFKEKGDSIPLGLRASSLLLDEKEIGEHTYYELRIILNSQQRRWHLH